MAPAHLFEAVRAKVDLLLAFFLCVIDYKERSTKSSAPNGFRGPLFQRVFHDRIGNAFVYEFV